MNKFRPAFLFLTRGDIHQPEIWRDFLNQSGGDHRLVVHAKHPERVRTSFLKEAMIEPRPTAWGHISLVTAMLRLLGTALKDPDATHFIFLSESCVPIKSWKTFACAIGEDPRSRIGMENANEMKKVHLNRIERVSPAIAREHWRIHSQWVLLDRTAANLITACDHTEKFRDVPVPDEHYIGTLLASMGFSEKHINKTDITHVNWRGGIPVCFSKITGDALGELRASRAFFARKFDALSDISHFKLHCATQDETMDPDPAADDTRKIPYFLFSFPRSGNHLCRFIAEYLTGRVSAGCSDNPQDIPICANRFPGESNPLDFVDISKTPIIQKVHRVREIHADSAKMAASFGLIFVHRDPAEAIINHATGEAWKFPELLDWMRENIRFFNNFNGPKVSIRYEELITDPVRSIERIATFMAPYVDHERLRRLKENHAELFQANRGATGRIWTPPSSGSDLAHHKNKSPAELLQRLQECMRATPLPEVSESSPCEIVSSRDFGPK